MKPLQGGDLKLLFEVELRYEEGMEPIHENGKLGSLVGSGRGRLAGPNLEGEVEWSLFETQGQQVCESNLFGRIRTHDEALIEFDSLGFFRRHRSGDPQQWTTSAAVRFQTEDPRYGWLTELLGVWHGEFDMQTYRHRYQVWAAQDPSSALSPPGT